MYKNWFCDQRLPCSLQIVFQYDPPFKIVSFCLEVEEGGWVACNSKIQDDQHTRILMSICCFSHGNRAIVSSFLSVVLVSRIFQPISDSVLFVKQLCIHTRRTLFSRGLLCQPEYSRYTFLQSYAISLHSRVHHRYSYVIITMYVCWNESLMLSDLITNSS